MKAVNKSRGEVSSSSMALQLRYSLGLLNSALPFKAILDFRGEVYETK
jgi:hypothetical protein